MKAIVYDGTHTPSVEERNVPNGGPGRAILRVLWAGICGTDLSIVGGKHPRAKPGLIMGHEIAARIEDVDSAATALRPGDLVTVEPTLSCGECIACRTGSPHVCRNLKLYGIDEPGGMAEYLAVEADRVHRSPRGVADDLVVLTEPLAVAVHSIRMSSIRFGDTVCVIGGGPIGLLVAIVAREVGVSTLIISEPNPVRRDVAGALGFEVIDPGAISLEEQVAQATRNQGIDIVIDAAGSQEAVSAATRVLRPRGRLVQVAIPKEGREISLVDVAFKELNVQGVRVYETLDFERAMVLLARRPDELRPLLSNPYSLDQAPEAFDAAVAGDRGMRVVFHVAEQ